MPLKCSFFFRADGGESETPSAKRVDLEQPPLLINEGVFILQFSSCVVHMHSSYRLSFILRPFITEVQILQCNIMPIFSSLNTIFTVNVLGSLLCKIQ